MAGVPFDMLDAIQEQALERCLWISMELIKAQLGPDGRVYGDVLPDRGERVARFIDLADRGVLDVLRTMSPETHTALMRDYMRDMQSSPLIGEA